MRIKAGEIASVPALKSEFKALAKSHHPDLRGPGASGADFIGLRAEYEIALRNFELHRFGFRPPADERAFDPAGLGRTLAALLKRGFPKTPRHEKEKARYEYYRYLARNQLNAAGEGRWELFEAFERALSAARKNDPPSFRDAIGLLEGVIELFGRPLPELASANAIALAALGRSLGRESPVFRFLDLLSGSPAVAGEAP